MADPAVLGALGSEIADNDMCEWEMQEVVAAARQNIEYLRNKGSMSTKGGYRQPMDEKVTTRTRNTRTTIKV